jgi:hypothetical protein
MAFIAYTVEVPLLDILIGVIFREPVPPATRHAAKSYLRNVMHQHLARTDRLRKEMGPTVAAGLASEMPNVDQVFLLAEEYLREVGVLGADRELSPAFATRLLHEAGGYRRGQ